MNRLMTGGSAFRIFAASAVILSSLSLASCHDANASKDKAESSLGQHRPDDALNKLMRSLAEGDAPGFAALCVYPIVRPYPLKNIEDSVSMVDYFPVLVDASLRDRMGRAKAEDWESYGWRGWSIGDDRPIWFDEGVQFVDYQSPAETGLQSILAREELMTLSPRYREGWTPVMTLIQTDGNSILRIDAKGDRYRLMEYDDATVMSPACPPCSFSDRSAMRDQPTAATFNSPIPSAQRRNTALTATLPTDSIFQALKLAERK